MFSNFGEEYNLSGRPYIPVEADLKLKSVGKMIPIVIEGIETAGGTLRVRIAPLYPMKSRERVIDAILEEAKR